MSSLFSASSRFVRLLQSGRCHNSQARASVGRKPRRLLLDLEHLERRDVPSVSISIGDATAIEGSTTLSVIDRFVANDGGPLLRLRGSTFGPDGNADGAPDFYVGAAEIDAVLRYDGVTGAFLDTFVSSGSGGLDAPYDLAFGPDGSLYVSGEIGNHVLRYNGSTGAFLGTIANGLSRPAGITFGPDGSLFIANENSDEILQYANSMLSVFVSAGSGGLDGPRHAVFGPDGNLYVGSEFTSQVLRYDGQTGDFLGVFANQVPGQGDLLWLEFGADGFLYTSVRTTSTVGEVSLNRFNAISGAYIDTLFIGRDSWSFIVGPENVVYYGGNGGGNFIERYGPASIAAFRLSLDSASFNPVSVQYATASGTAQAGSDYTATTGTMTFAPGQTTRTILVQAIDDALAEGAETFFVNLSNPVGATVADGQGVGTVFDKTRFYVVDDAAANRTYEYGTTGLATENYVLNSGNTAPRGAASTAAGTTVWVVDANRTVYVYSDAGALLGSWSAGGLNPSAQVEGIATNGTDIWLVDAKQDKVFRYTGAASRLSGSQNAASSFNLNSGNSSPKDLVTDGTSVWVVNDSTTDKVFKYTLSGSLLGSWTLSSGGGSPTGITLDPSNGQQHLWVVDSATDRVYQYDGTRSLTSGSQAASVTFGLAAGNTNPQGIADPPAISIDDATAIEGSKALRLVDRFVAEGSGGIIDPNLSVFGPDGNQDGVPDLYVAGGKSDAIHRYDGVSGAFIDNFVAPGGGGLDLPRGLTFGPDGDLYVGSDLTSQILRYNGLTGAFLEVVASGLAAPHGITTGSDGSLYIANQNSHEILRYVGGNLTVFVTARSGGLSQPRRAVFGPDGNGDGRSDLYVASQGNGKVLRYDGLTGAFIDTFAVTGTTIGPCWLAFGTDGFLYTSARTNATGSATSFIRFNAATGAFVDSYALARDGWSFTIGSDNLIYDSSNGGNNFNFVERFGPQSLAVFTVRLDAPSEVPVTVKFTTADGTAAAGSDFVATSDTLTFAPGQTTRTILVRTLDDALAEPAETFAVTLSNPVGATIADGQAVGTITDNEPFQVSSAVVNSGAAQRSRVTDLTVTFTGLATLPANPADAFRLTRTGPTGLTGDVALSVDLSASTATQSIARLTFSGPFTASGSLVDGTYTLTAFGSQVTGNSQPLDGDGDSSPGGDYTLALHRLFGDANGDHTVNAADLTLFRGAYGTSDPTFDVNGDGVINAADLAAFRTNYGASV